MLFQNYALFPHMTVGENVAFGLEARGVRRHMTAERVTEALRLVQLDDYKERMPAQLSGGQQQRVALARALVVQPALLLLDEPLGALDALTRERMQELLLDLWHRTGKSLFLITHSIEEALFLATRLVVMSPRPGRIAEIIEIKLERPRDFDMEARHEFQDATHRIRALIFGSRKARAV